MFPLALIVLGIAVLLFGNRLAILGAAVGGLLGVVLLRFFPDAVLSTQLLIVLGLAVAGFFLAAFARGVIEVVILVIGALAGAAVVLGLLDLFKVDQGILNWLLAVVGAVIGLMVIRRSRRGDRDWGMIILADLVGALLILRGLTLWFPSLSDTFLSTVILLGLLVLGFVFMGGYLGRRKAAAPAAAVPPAKAAPPPAAAPVVPPVVEPTHVEPPMEPPAKPPDSVA